jgi:hypothetical protein
MDPKEISIDVRNWMELDQGRDPWRALEMLSSILGFHYQSIT